jgi:hypothetical protein
MTDRRDLLATPHRAAHEASSRQQNDRIANRPRTTRALLSWAKRAYGLEPPPRLHSGRELAPDGDPQMTGEAQSYIGFSQDKEPNDWVSVACRLDVDGYYVTPLRCAIERLRAQHPKKADLAASLCVHVFYYKDVTRRFDIPDEFAEEIVRDVLGRLYDSCVSVPIRGPKPKTEDVA